MTSKWGSIGNYQAESHSQVEEDFIEFEYQPWYGRGLIFIILRLQD